MRKLGRRETREGEGRVRWYEYNANHECGIDVDKMDYIKRDVAKGSTRALRIESMLRRLGCQNRQGTEEA